MTNRAKTTAILKAKPGKEDELESLLRNMTVPCRSEPGNLRWDLWRDRNDAATFVVDELYKDAASVEAHRATQHYKDYASKIGDLASRTAITSDPVDVA
jgi:quinol monooxygenase YgiN